MRFAFAKTLLLTLLAVTLTASPALAASDVAACGGDKHATPGETTPATATKAVIPVKGMTCGSCAGKVRQALTAIEGVFEATIDVAAGEAHISYDAARVTTAALVKAIEGAGYTTGAPTAPKS